MQYEIKNKQCLCVIGSMTQTMQAKKLLDSASVHTQIIKADSGESNRGCAYALTYSCAFAQTVRQILSRAGIRIQASYGEGK